MASPREASPSSQHGVVPLALISTAFQFDGSLEEHIRSGRENKLEYIQPKGYR